MPQTKTPRNAAQELADELVRHQARGARLEPTVQRVVAERIERLTRSLTRLIKRRGSMGRAVYSAASNAVQNTYRSIAEDIRATHGDLAQIEGEFFSEAINKTLNAQVASPLPANFASAVTSAVRIQGATDLQWWTRQSRKVREKFNDHLRMSIASSAQTNDIVDGWANLMNISKTQAQTQVRTGMNRVMNEARNRVTRENEDIIKGQTVVATLDMRTSEVCRVRDGMAWDLDGRPMNERTSSAYPGPPPYHWNCRSAMVPIMKSFEEITNGKIKAKIPKGTRASMNGQVPADMTYQQWFNRLTTAQQTEILGPGKYELWKKNKLSFADMIDQSGRPLTLAELKPRSKAQALQALNPNVPSPIVRTPTWSANYTPEVQRDQFSAEQKFKEWLEGNKGYKTYLSKNALPPEGSYAVPTRIRDGKVVSSSYVEVLDDTDSIDDKIKWSYEAVKEGGDNNFVEYASVFNDDKTILATSADQSSVNITESVVHAARKSPYKYSLIHNHPYTGGALSQADLATHAGVRLGRTGAISNTTGSVFEVVTKKPFKMMGLSSRNIASGMGHGLVESLTAAQDAVIKRAFDYLVDLAPSAGSMREVLYTISWEKGEDYASYLWEAVSHGLTEVIARENTGTAFTAAWRPGARMLEIRNSPFGQQVDKAVARAVDETYRSIKRNLY